MDFEGEKSTLGVKTYSKTQSIAFLLSNGPVSECSTLSPAVARARIKNETTI